jgi:Pilus formation protein N terminal region
MERKLNMGVRARHAALLVLPLLLVCTPAGAEDLVVRYDQSQLLRMPRAVSEIIVGNPSIADVTVQSGNMLVVTGKTFGITNIIALDAEKNVIQDQRIVVERDDRGIVNVSRAGQRQSFSCTPNCAPTIMIGDEAAYFNQVIQSSTTKTRFSETGTDGGGGGNPASQ